MSTYDRAHATIKLAAKVALRGGQQRLLTFVAPWLPKCHVPRYVYRGHTRMRGLRSVEVSMHVPCRRCPRCLQHRQMTWRSRALVEIARANRTWWITLTFSPVQLAGVLASARSPEAADIERRAYRDVQRWLDAIRDAGRKGGAKWKIRYLAVFERGEKSGRMHYHVLLHETGARPIPKLVLEQTWPSHVHARLVDPTQPGLASYITKYATKDFTVRPRASGGYGDEKGRNDTGRAKKSLRNTSSLPDAHTLKEEPTGDKCTSISDELRITDDDSRLVRGETLLKNGCDDAVARKISHVPHDARRRRPCTCSRCRARAARALDFEAVHRTRRTRASVAHAPGAAPACGCATCRAARSTGAEG